MAASFLKVSQFEKQGINRAAVHSGVGLCGDTAIWEALILVFLTSALQAGPIK